MLTWSDPEWFDASFIKAGEKTRNLCANTWKQLPLLHSGLPMVRVHRLRVQWAESAGSHATRSSVCAEPLGHERAGELFALPGVRGTEGKEVERVRAARGAAKRTWAHEHRRGPATGRGAMGLSLAGKRKPLWPGVEETRGQLSPGVSDQGAGIPRQGLGLSWDACVPSTAPGGRDKELPGSSSERGAQCVPRSES